MASDSLRDRTEASHRYERKFVARGVTLHEVEMCVRLHPALFHKIYYPRYVNNIYFDTCGLDSYAETLSGVGRRSKTRIRWYGEFFSRVEGAALEIKHKHGLVGWKDTFELAAFDMREDFRPAEIVEVLNSSDLPAQLRAELSFLEPALANRYLRGYYLSRCGRFRVTLDSELEFRPPPLPGGRFTFTHVDNAVVLELKYEKEHDGDAVSIGSLFPFGLTSFSKYGSGIDALSLC